MNPIKDSNQKIVAIGAFVFAILISILYFIFQATDLYVVLRNTTMVATSLCATVVAYLIIRKYRWDIHNSFSRCWLFFFLGMLFWFLGELIWAIYVLGLGIEVPYPFIVDIFWLTAYPFFFMALLGYFKMFGLPFVSKKKVAIMGGAIFGASFLMTLFSLYLISVLGDEPLVLLLNLTYPIADLLLFILAFGSLIVFFGQKIGKSYIYLTSAIIILIIADSIFSFLTTTGGHICGNYLVTLDDLLYVWGLLASFLGFYVHLKEF